MQQIVLLLKKTHLHEPGQETWGKRSKL